MGSRVALNHLLHGRIAEFHTAYVSGMTNHSIWKPILHAYVDEKGRAKQQLEEAAINAMVLAGEDPNLDWWGDTPLSVAFNWQMSEQSIRCLACVSDPSVSAKSVLQYLLREMDLNGLMLFLCVWGCVPVGVNALHMAFEEGLHSPLLPSVLKLLLQNGSNVNELDSRTGRTVLHRIACVPVGTNDCQNEIVRILLAHGADITVLDLFNDTAYRLWLGVEPHDEHVGDVLREHVSALT